MGRRRKARERALQVLYQMDVSGTGAEEALESASEEAEERPTPAVRKYLGDLVLGVTQNRQVIDEIIQRHSANWRVDRMARVDRNVLRMATFELMHQPEVPPKVVLNEAIEIAKRFGSEESGAFINGILDKVAREIAASEEEV